MSEFKTIETQEQLDAIIKDRISRAQDAVRKEFADYDQLKEQIAGFDAVKADYEARLSEASANSTAHEAAMADIQKKLKRYEMDSVKTKVAIEVGIPYEMASRLSGENEDEIRADAANIARFVSHKSFPIGSGEPFLSGNDKSAESYKKLAGAFRQK